MGTVIPFRLPTLSCNQRAGRRQAAPATIIILPVVRYERWDADRAPETSSAAASGRNHRARTGKSRAR
jgi:hypothetical protein